jgi:hypothetical protein
VTTSLKNGRTVRIQVSLEGNSQGLQFAPLNVEPIEIGIADFASEDPRTDQIKFDNLFSGYQPLQITNPQTGSIESSPFYFGYVGAVEGEPQSITKDQLVLPGTKNSVNFPDGETVTYTLYGRVFSTEEASPIKITGITEDTGVKGDFRTSDNTLIFNGTAEAGSNVEVFLDLDGESDSIGTTTADANGNWSYDHTGVEIPDSPDNPDNLAEKKYKLTAESTNSYGEINSATELLEVDTNYDIYPDFDFSDSDFSDTNFVDNPKVEKLEAKIEEAASYWENIILNDIPDVNDPKAGGLVDDLEIKFKVIDIKDKEEDSSKEDKLATTTNYRFRDKLGNSIDPLTGKPLSTFNKLPHYAEILIDRDDIDEIIDTSRGLDTLKHEIAHAIGFNTSTVDEQGWLKENINNSSFPDFGLFDNGNGFTGPNALQAYKDLGGNPDHTSVPLQNGNKNDGKGLVHWNEWLFPDGKGEKTDGITIRGQDELMTTEAPLGNENVVLSKLTLGAFQDLGFTVDLTKGDENLKINLGGIQDDTSYANPLFNIDY